MFQPPLPPTKAAAIRAMGFGVVNKLLVAVAKGPSTPDAPTPPNVSPASLLHDNPNTQGTIPSPTPSGGPTASTTSFAFLQPVEPSAGPPFASSSGAACAAGCDAVETVNRWTNGVSSLHFGGHGFLVPTDNAGGVTPRTRSAHSLAMVWVSGAHALALEGTDTSQVVDDVQEVCLTGRVGWVG